MQIRPLAASLHLISNYASNYPLSLLSSSSTGSISGFERVMYGFGDLLPRLTVYLIPPLSPFRPPLVLPPFQPAHRRLIYTHGTWLTRLPISARCLSKPGLLDVLSLTVQQRPHFPLLHCTWSRLSAFEISLPYATALFHWNLFLRCIIYLSATCSLSPSHAYILLSFILSRLRCRLGHPCFLHQLRHQTWVFAIHFGLPPSCDTDTLIDPYSFLSLFRLLLCTRLLILTRSLLHHALRACLPTPLAVHRASRLSQAGFLVSCSSFRTVVSLITPSGPATTSAPSRDVAATAFWCDIPVLLAPYAFVSFSGVRTPLHSMLAPPQCLSYRLSSFSRAILSSMASVPSHGALSAPFLFMP
ncbi:hypothetical protein B0H13DRAFT_2316661 [Mycena leptocephala]|nr:hypothetical protein B0H13DRAFT_2316661 [Mycena leptocephala]